MDRLKILGIPFEFGQTQSGVREAFSYLVNHGLVTELSRIAPVTFVEEMKLPFKTFSDSGPIHHQQACSDLNAKISWEISTLNLGHSFLLTIGGDHGMGLGTVHGMLEHNPETVVIWADAHGDINTPATSPTGNFHGMPLAFLLGLVEHHGFDWVSQKLNPQNLIFFGPRDLDPGEMEIIQRLQIQYFSSEEINRIGTKDVLEMALHRADPYQTKPIHLSFDVDLFDRHDLYSTGTKVSHGPNLEEIFLLGGLLGESGRLKSMDIVEFNPLIGNLSEVSHSAELIKEFIQTTLRQVFSHKTDKMIQNHRWRFGEDFGMLFRKF
jgi:arginase